MANRVMARAARRRFGPMQGKDGGHGRCADLAAVPACVHPDEPPRHRRPAPRRPGGGRSAVLPDRRRQDGSLSRPGGLHPGLSPPEAIPDYASAGPQRADALHAAPADARPARPRGNADLRPGAGAAARTRTRSAHGRSRSASGSAGPPRRTGWAARATTIRIPPDRRPSPSRTTTASPPRSRSKNCPWCGTSSSRHSFQLLPNANEPTDLRVVCAESPLRLHPQPAAADPGRRRADLSPAAVLPDRHGGQVRRHALDRRGRRPSSAGSTATTSTDSTALASRTGDAACRRPLPAAGPDHPGRIAPDLRPDGHDGRALRDCPGRAVQPGIDGKKVRPKIIASTATVRRAENQIQALFNRREVDIFPPPGPDRRDSFFAETHPTEQEQPPALPGTRRPGTQSQGRDVADLSGPARGRPEGVRRRRRQEEPDNAADPYMTLARLFQQPARAGGQPPHRRGRGQHPAHWLRQPQADRPERKGSSPTARSPTRSSS